MLRIIKVSDDNSLKSARELFLEYADYLGVDLSFQEFNAEVEELPGEYSPPDGRLLLAYYNDELAGCVALRKFREGTCEMKRLYVREKFRGKGIGKALSKKIIEVAGEIGYEKMRLDTLPFMREAITLYKSLGFYEIEPYRYNPIEGAEFYELDLMMNKRY